MRLCIAGVPKAGKTTLSRELGANSRVRHTDDLLDQNVAWSDASAQVATWLDVPGPWVIEGVAVPRALRKWFVSHATGKPCDRVVWLGRARIPLLDGQQRMAKGCETVWREVRPILEARGVQITEA